MVVLHVESFLNSIDNISKIFLLSPHGKISKEESLPSWRSCSISNILTFIGFISYVSFHLVYVTDTENDAAIDHAKVVTFVIDFYNKYSGCFIVTVLTTFSYFHQSKTAKIHKLFTAIDKIIRTELKVEIENLITTRIVYFQALFMFTAVTTMEYFNCLMYIRPVNNFVQNCMILCLVPMLLMVAIECRIFAYFLLIKARFKLINALIHDYRRNIDKFNRSPSRMCFLWTIANGHVFYINDYPKPRKFIDKSYSRKSFMAKIKIIKILKFIKNLLNFKINHYHAYPRENVACYNFNYIDRIMSMQTIYTKLLDIFDLIREAYGMQIIALITIQFITLTTLMYDFSMNIVRLLSSDISTKEKDEAIDQISSSGLWIVIFMYKIYSMCCCIDATIEEGQKIGNYIHIFGLRTNILDEKFKIKMFLLRILHRKINFAPFGLFEINLKLFSMILGAISTYILILIQFDIAQKT